MYANRKYLHDFLIRRQKVMHESEVAENNMQKILRFNILK